MDFSRLNKGDTRILGGFREYAPLVPAGLFLCLLPINHTMALRMLCLFLMTGGALYGYFKAGAPALPIKFPLALWAGFAVLSLAWSFDPVFSLNEIKTEIGYGMLAFLSFFVLTRSGWVWRLWLYCLAAGLLVTVALALWVNYDHLRNFAGYDWDWLHGFVAYSTYLALIAPFLLALWLAAPLRVFPRNLAWLLAPLFLLAGYATLNRMFWLSLGAILLVYAVLWRRGGAKSRRAGLLAAGAAFALVVLLFVAVAAQRPVDPLKIPAANAGTASHVLGTFENSERFQIWRFWLERVAERPWTGVGFGRDLPHYVHADLKPKEWAVLMFAHAHNLFFNYALQLGVGGLAALLLLFGALLREFWRIRRAPAPDAAIVGLCGIALVVTLASKNMTDDLFWRSDSLLFWALAGIALGYGKRLEQAQ